MSTDPRDSLQPKLDGFALVLGASSGFGEACALSLAKAGMSIVGVHLDRRSAQSHIDELQKKIRDFGVESWFYNVNAADEGKRRDVLDDVKKKLDERGKSEKSGSSSTRSPSGRCSRSSPRAGSMRPRPTPPRRSRWR